MHTILLADNDSDYLTLTKEFLEKRGFRVVTAANPTDTRKIIAEQHIDLAILDLRLVDDRDEYDKSGLYVARELAWGRFVPRIVISNAATLNNMREAVIGEGGGLAPASNFFAKREGHEVLLAAIHEVLTLDVRHIRCQIVEHFNESELRNLCFDLGVDFESLGGQGKADKARELVAFFERRGLIAILVRTCRQQRPQHF